MYPGGCYFQTISSWERDSILVTFVVYTILHTVMTDGEVVRMSRWIANEWVAAVWLDEWVDVE